jgi:hypothetical protein
LLAYNCAKRRNTLRDLTPYEYICQCWQQAADHFTMNPYHHTLGLNKHAISTDGGFAIVGHRIHQRCPIGFFGEMEE